MISARAIAVGSLLLVAGCFLTHTPAPEEVAINVYQDAEELFAAKDYDEAARKYEFVIQARDRWKDPYLKLAQCRHAVGREADAMEILRRLLAVDRYDEQALERLGRLLAARGENSRALECFRRLREVRPADLELGREIARLEALGQP